MIAAIFHVGNAHVPAFQLREYIYLLLLVGFLFISTIDQFSEISFMLHQMLIFGGGGVSRRHNVMQELVGVESGYVVLV